MVTSGIFWNLEIGNREIWKIPEIGWFGPILTFWVYFPLSLGHWAWFWSQKFKILIFLQFENWKLGFLGTPKNGLIWTNFDFLGIFSTQFRSLNFDCEVISIFLEFCQKISGNFLEFVILVQFQHIEYHSYLILVI